MKYPSDETRSGPPIYAAPILAGFVSLILILLACTQGGRSGAPAIATGRLDVLTSFAIAVSKNDFPRALQFLAPEERLLFLDGSGSPN